jgi:hypothetical protein
MVLLDRCPPFVIFLSGLSDEADLLVPLLLNLAGMVQNIRGLSRKQGESLLCLCCVGEDPIWDLQLMNRSNILFFPGESIKFKPRYT